MTRGTSVRSSGYQTTADSKSALQVCPCQPFSTRLRCRFDQRIGTRAPSSRIARCLTQLLQEWVRHRHVVASHQPQDRTSSRQRAVHVHPTVKVCVVGDPCARAIATLTQLRFVRSDLRVKPRRGHRVLRCRCGIWLEVVDPVEYVKGLHWSGVLAWVLDMHKHVGRNGRNRRIARRDSSAAPTMRAAS